MLGLVVGVVVAGAVAGAVAVGLASLRKGRDSSPEGPIFRGSIV